MSEQELHTVVADPIVGIKVFLIVQGERYEGSNVNGIFSTQEKAIAYVEEITSRDDKQLRRKWKQDSLITWSRGCDYIAIEENTIQ